jgi:hypothetical protein
MEPGDVYEVRYGPTMKNIAMMVGSAAFAIGCLLPEMPLYIRVLGGVLFGGGSLVFLAVVVSRQVAFRVDADGITMAGGRLRYQANLLSVPWAEIEAVVLWTQLANLSYVGIQRRADSPAIQRPGRAGRLALGALVPHVPTEIAQSSRAINGWRLNRDRLTLAVAHFAPGVEIVDLG